MAKLAIFLPSLRGGGAERVMVILANLFSSQGHTVDLVLASAKGPYLSEVSERVRIVDLGVSRVLAGLPKLVGYLRSERPDALLSALWHANVLASLALTFAGVSTRLVVSERNSVAALLAKQRIAFFVRWTMRLAYSRAEKVVAVTRGVGRELHELINVREGKIRVIYNPVSIDDINDMSNKSIPFDSFLLPNERFVLAVGRLAKQKDYPTLLKAFKLVRQKHDVKLVILGEGELRGELEAFAQELGVHEYLVMPGFQSNPFAWMKRCSCFVLSSRWEGLPNVLLQALACGAKVVATDSLGGGAREILDAAGSNGLVPVGDEFSFARKMMDMLDDQVMSGQYDLSCFRADVVCQQYLDVLLG